MYSNDPVIQVAEFQSLYEGLFMSYAMLWRAVTIQRVAFQSLYKGLFISYTIVDNENPADSAVSVPQ